MRPKSYSTAQIAEMAAEFRSRYAPNVRGALDIEAILEHDLGLTIIPRPELSRMTGKKAWLSCNGLLIYVDEGLMCGSYEEYRFTMAHEGAHAVLHDELLPGRILRSASEFWAYHDRLSERDNYFLEWQAREWAGRVLVPSGELKEVFEGAVQRAFQVFGRRVGPMSFYVEQEVAQHFGVTGACAHVRISKERLWRSVGVAA